jgi:hypothetical protein
MRQTFENPQETPSPRRLIIDLKPRKIKNLPAPLSFRLLRLLTAVQNAVTSRGHGHSEYGNEHGISIYFPDPVWAN